VKYLVAAVAFLPFAFSADRENIDIYILPLDANHARVKGSLTRVTTDPSIYQRPSLSIDGKKLAWETSRGGNFEVWVKDLVSGQEHAITSGPLREHMPALSRDGSKLLYDAHDGDKVMIFESSFTRRRRRQDRRRKRGPRLVPMVRRRRLFALLPSRPAWNSGTDEPRDQAAHPAPPAPEAQPLARRRPPVAR